MVTAEVSRKTKATFCTHHTQAWQRRPQAVDPESTKQVARPSHRQHPTRAAPESWQIYLIHRNKYKESSQNGKTKKQAPNERTREFSNEIEASNLSDTEFRVMSIRTHTSMKKT